MQTFFREIPKKRSFKNVGKNLAPPVSEVPDPLVIPDILEKGKAQLSKGKEGPKKGEKLISGTSY